MSQILLPYNTLARKFETRSMPTLLEQRNNLLEKLDNLVKKAKEETRALTPEENEDFNKTKTEIEGIDQTIAAEETAENLANNGQQQKKKNPEQEEQRSLDESKLLRYIRGEERALDVAGNGGIIPETIANRIIEKVKELSPIYQRATIFNVGGDLVFPLFDYETITTAFVADMTALTPQNGNFTTLKLSNFIAGSLVQVSRSLMNRTDFDLVTFIVNNMAMSIADFLENQLLNGVGTTAPTGIFVDGNVQTVTAAGANAIGTNDLIELQMSVPEVFQPNSCWIMNKTIFRGLRQLKDTQGYPLLNQDITQAYGWTLFGKPVHVSENAPNTLTTGLRTIAYGDMSGLYVKLAQNVEIQVLNELYATSHATGIVGYIEFDSRVIEKQKISVLELA